jgi:hypothetical protein
MIYIKQLQKRIWNQTGGLSAIYLNIIYYS